MTSSASVTKLVKTSLPVGLAMSLIAPLLLRSPRLDTSPGTEPAKPPTTFAVAACAVVMVYFCPGASQKESPESTKILLRSAPPARASMVTLDSPMRLPAAPVTPAETIFEIAACPAVSWYSGTVESKIISLESVCNVDRSVFSVFAAVFIVITAVLTSLPSAPAAPSFAMDACAAVRVYGTPAVNW